MGQPEAAVGRLHAECCAGGVPTLAFVNQVLAHMEYNWNDYVIPVDQWGDVLACPVDPATYTREVQSGVARCGR